MAAFGVVGRSNQIAANGSGTIGVMTAADSVRPNILRIRPYVPGKPIQEVQRELGIANVVKLASNENPLGPSPMAVEAMERALRDVHFYPDAGAVDLREKLAERNGVKPSQVAMGCGSDELLTMLGMAFLNPGDEMVIGDPSFLSYYLVADRCDAKLVKVTLTEDERHDLPAMAGASGSMTRLAIIANPNNPTATLVRQTELNDFINALPAHVLPVIDEAYYEYFPEEGSAIEFLKQGRDVCVLRTFSKAYGLAGLRVGYMFGPEWLVDAMERTRMPFNVSSIGQAAAIAALDDNEHLRKTIDTNRAALIGLATFLDALGMRHTESYANFAWADTRKSAADLFEALLRKGVIIRPGQIFGRPTHIRVTTGTKEQMTVFEKAFREVLGQ